MASLILKPDGSSFTIWPEKEIENDPRPSDLIRAILLLNRATGAILVVIGVTVLVANVFTGFALLLGGRDFVIKLLTGL